MLVFYGGFCKFEKMTIENKNGIERKTMRTAQGVRIRVRPTNFHVIRELNSHLYIGLIVQGYIWDGSKIR